jgi:hypothetical protein
LSASASQDHRLGFARPNRDGLHTTISGTSFLLLGFLNNPAITWKVLWTFLAAVLLFALVGTVVAGPKAAEIASLLILLAIAAICWRIYVVRRRLDTSAFTGQARIWFIFALGFFYLALDEGLSIHEEIDFFIHWLFGIAETGLTDRIDDFIVFLYAMVGLVVLYFHWQELRSISNQKRLFAAGFLFLFLMVAADASGNRPDVAIFLGFSEPDAIRVDHVLDIVEEFFKLAAESAFLVAFARIHEGSAKLRATRMK